MKELLRRVMRLLKMNVNAPFGSRKEAPDGAVGKSEGKRGGMGEGSVIGLCITVHRRDNVGCKYPIGGHSTLFAIRLPLPLELRVGPNRSNARRMQSPASTVSNSQLARSGDHSRSQQRAHGSGKTHARRCSRRIAQRPSAAATAGIARWLSFQPFPAGSCRSVRVITAVAAWADRVRGPHTQVASQTAQLRHRAGNPFPPPPLSFPNQDVRRGAAETPMYDVSKVPGHRER